MDKENPNAKQELTFCLQLWGAKGECAFGEKTKCEKCAAPYVLYKMITGKAIHTERRFSLEEWKELLNEIED